MQTFWTTDMPLSRPEILERVVQHDWNPNSIHLVLNNLMKKGFLKVDGIARCGKGYGRTYIACISQGEYVAKAALSAVSDVPKQSCVLEVMSAMLKHAQIDGQTIQTLKQMLDERRKELERNDPDNQKEG